MNYSEPVSPARTENARKCVYPRSVNSGVEYDVLPDGRFVMVRGPDPTNTREIVVQNWFEETEAPRAREVTGGATIFGLVLK